MNWLAWTVFAVFLAWVVQDGVRRGTASRTLDEYYAGGRRIPWWAAGLSVMATQASAITVIGTTGEGHDGGLGFVQFYFGLPFALIVLCLFFVPAYRRLPILTVYEWLETRFNPATRALASLVFLASRCLALGVVITAPAVVMSSILGLPLTTTIIGVGVLTTLYTVFGGVSAVIWTDVKQMAVILVGICICFGLLAVEICSEIGVLGAIRAAGAAGKLNALELLPPSTDLMPRLEPAVDHWVGRTDRAPSEPSFWEFKYTLWTGLIGGFFLQLSYFGCDLSQAQRILTSKDANASRRALLVSAFAKVPMQFLVLSLGVLLWLHHALHAEPLLFSADDRLRAAAEPEELARLTERHDVLHAERREALQAIASSDRTAADWSARLARYQAAITAAENLRTEAATRFGAKGKREDRNYVFPHWIQNNLPPLLLGLIVAAIFAAAMSSVDSVLNSLSAATVVDFYRRWLRPNCSQQHAVTVGRFVTLLWGAVATLTAIQMISGSSMIEQINRIGSFFYGSLLGVFLLGLFCPWARGSAGFVGLCGGMASVLAVHWTLRIEFLWYNVVGVLGVIATALVWRLVHGRHPA